MAHIYPWDKVIPLSRNWALEYSSYLQHLKKKKQQQQKKKKKKNTQKLTQ